jgi:hypothetical protein
VEINDIAVFRAEIDVEPDYLNSDFFLDINLFFLNLENQGGQENWQEVAATLTHETEFKLVQSQKFKIVALP